VGCPVCDSRNWGCPRGGETTGPSLSQRMIFFGRNERLQVLSRAEATSADRPSSKRGQLCVCYIG
jgi:hypothetical protein